MRALPLIPYENLQQLISGKYTSPQMNYYINICRLADSNGINDDVSLNSFIQKIISSVGCVLSRATGYRSIEKFVSNNLLTIDESGRLAIPGYTDSFQKGSSGLVTIPMFCMSGKFRKLDKLHKRVALHLIGQLREIETQRTPFPVSIEKLAAEYEVCYSQMFSVLENLSFFFKLTFKHNQTVCLITYKDEYLLPSSVREKDLTSNYNPNETTLTKAAAVIKDLLRTKGITELLEERINGFTFIDEQAVSYDEIEKKYVHIEDPKELDIENNVNVIVKKLLKFKHQERVHILESLASKLRQYSSPIRSIGAYLNSILEDNINVRPKTLYLID